MQLKKVISTLVIVLILSCHSDASPRLDRSYGFRNMVVAVVSNSPEKIHAAQVQAELLTQVQKQTRFEYQENASSSFQKSIESIFGPQVARGLTERFELFRPTLQSLKKDGVDAAVLAELEKKDESFDLTLTLVNAEPGEVTAQSVKKINPPFSMESFTQATAQAFSELTKHIPFDGTVLKRDGYLVILDGGSGTYAPGMRLPTFTLEKQGDKLAYDETGVVMIEKAEENISFAKILVEKKPLEVLSGNKIRLSQKLVSNDLPELMKEVTDANREPASELVSDFEVSKGEVGRLAVNLGTDLVEFRNRATDGNQFYSNVFFPGAQLEGELWFTSRWYMDTTLGFSAAQFPNTAAQPNDAQSSSLSTFRLQFGYRMNILAPERGPVIYAKLGYGKFGYSLGTTQPVLFTSVVYGGMLLTGGIKVPFDDQWNLTGEINTLIFPSMAETPSKSGTETSNINAWDFALKGTYSLSDSLDLEGRLIFRNASAEFAGDSDRPDPIAQATQSSKILQVGVSYYF